MSRSSARCWERNMISTSDPAILQLYKWRHSPEQLDLSEFRQAFISPTRSLILLLSYNCEALLISLDEGKAEASIDFRSFASSAESTDPTYSGFLDNSPLTCGFEAYSYLSDVNSLAWAVPNTTYDQHCDGTQFTEFLFVSGSHGLTLHAFCHSDMDMNKGAGNPFQERGTCIEWGPFIHIVDDSNIDPQCSLYSHEIMLDDSARNNASFSSKDEKYELSRHATSKPWLRTYHTKVERLELDSNSDMWTKFPDKYSCSFSVKVISFSIFDNSLDAHSGVFPRSSLDNSQNGNSLIDTSFMSAMGSNSLQDILSKLLDFGLSNSYRCTKVFSNDSNNLVGLFLTLVKPVSMTESDESGRSLTQSLLITSRIHRSGIQWLSTVKLEESHNIEAMTEWIDFQFSEELVVCLKASGSVFFYGAKTGEYISHLNILHSCGLNVLTNLIEEPSSLSNEVEERVGTKVRHVGILTEPSLERDHFLSKRIFRSLIVTSYSSLVAAVDQYGIVYVIRMCDHFPTISYSSDNLIPCSWDSRRGMFAWWEIGGSDITYKRIYDHSSLSSSPVSPRNGSLNSRHFCNCSTSSKIIDYKLTGLHSQSYTLRNIFLPKYKYSEGDHICFSPLGITRLIKRKSQMGDKSLHVIHSLLHVESVTTDEGCSNSEFDLFSGGEGCSIIDAIGCAFHGYCYLVTRDGLSVILPSISVSGVNSVLSTQSRQPSCCIGIEQHQTGNIFRKEVPLQSCSPWKVEVLDRTLLLESPQEADRLCLINGWNLKIGRMRRLQLALNYLKFEEIEQSLEMLVHIHVAEEGILRLVFFAVYLAFCKASNDSEISAVSRLLILATAFATKMIRRYRKLGCSQESFNFHAIKPIQCSLPTLVNAGKINLLRKLKEVAHLLEVIRRLQCQVIDTLRRPGQVMVVDGQASNLADTDSIKDDTYLSSSSDSMPPEIKDPHRISSPVTVYGRNNPEMLALMPLELLDKDNLDAHNAGQISDGIDEKFLIKNLLPFEHPKDMMARWESANMDIRSIVEDALVSGRLPLAVLQLQLKRLKDFVADKEPYDSFVEVRIFGKAISYDLFLKGEIVLAVSILQRLGEDMESSLKQLVFGTVRRSLRMQVAEETKRFGYLEHYQWKLLDRISLIERLYPSSSFWRTYHVQHKESIGFSSSSNSLGEFDFCIASPDLNIVINCGEIDGVVLGSWPSLSEISCMPVVDDSDAYGFWAAAAIWFHAWDSSTTDRIILDRPFPLGVDVSWESQLEYYSSRNNWGVVSELLNVIPLTLLSDGILQIDLGGLPRPSDFRSSGEYPNLSNYTCSVEQIDYISMGIPSVKILRVPLVEISSMWLRTLYEQETVKKLMFPKKYFNGTAEIVQPLSRSGLFKEKLEISLELDAMGKCNPNNLHSGCVIQADTLQAMGKLMLHHSRSYSLPKLLDLYINCSKLVVDDDSLFSLLEAAGECQWEKWLLLTGIRGSEYEASFSNWCSVISYNLGYNISVSEIGEMIHTADDMAEGGGELAALATLMYAPAPIQNCLTSGSIKRHPSSSAQCTLENLRPTIQRFPALWRTLLASGFGQDTTYNFVTPKSRDGFFSTSFAGLSSLSEFLNWRLNIFLATGRDASLFQILPSWFPKSLRKFIRLFVQGPLGLQSLTGFPSEETFIDRDMDFLIDVDGQEISAIYWEAAIQKQVKEELYDSSSEEAGHGIEHYLHRGRPLAAFTHLLGFRAQKLKTNIGYQGQSTTLPSGQANIQVDVQRLLAPITQSEASLLCSVTPLALVHFEDTMLSASCAFLLELCGLSASMLRVDVASLSRILSFCKSDDHSDYGELCPESSTFHPTFHEGNLTDFLAQSLADDYVQNNSARIKENPNPLGEKQSIHVLKVILEHLEKASLPHRAESKTCGSWLLNGIGDGSKLRSQQKADSLYWNLVTVFCQMHHIPLSTKYLAVLARDNDWVGFLSEAQLGGYPSDAVVQVASKDFSDPCLRCHILTILKSMHSRRKAVSLFNPDDLDNKTEVSIPDGNLYIPVELFGVLAECEKQKNPGKALLRKAKDLCWSILALVASCFGDVSLLSCLTVWLEITAARETSSIKVNDIASQIGNNVGAAVQVLNSLPVANREITFHYNRRSAKRRRLVEPMMSCTSPNIIATSDPCADITMPVTDDYPTNEGKKKSAGEDVETSDSAVPDSLSNMVAILCEQHLFLPLLRAFEIFLPSCSLLPFIRSLQAFTQMRLSEASAHLDSFSARIKEEPSRVQVIMGREELIGVSWIGSMAVRAADAILSKCPSPYEKKCLLQLLAGTDFGDGGSAAAYYQRLYWKINLVEPLLSKINYQHLERGSLDDASLLTLLENNGLWEQARTWAQQMESAGGGPWKSVVHHVTETQAESMVAEWKEFLWDVPEERVALWGHCQTLFIRYSYPALKAGLFFLKHAEFVEKDLPVRELHELLLLSLQWLSGMMTQSHPVYPLHLLREIETRVWLLAVESEAQVNSERNITLANSRMDTMNEPSLNIIGKTAGIIAKMDSHINITRNRMLEKSDARDDNQTRNKNAHVLDINSAVGAAIKSKRMDKGYLSSREIVDIDDRGTDHDYEGSPAWTPRSDVEMQDENLNIEVCFSRWEERVGPTELERAVLSLLEFGQITAAKQLQNKLSPGNVPFEFILVDVALKLAAVSSLSNQGSLIMLDDETQAVIKSHLVLSEADLADPMKVLESLAGIFTEGHGRGLCRRIIAVVKAAHVLGLSFSEAFNKQPIEVLQLLSLKAQDSFVEAKLLVQNHSLPAASVAQILAESFLKGLLAAHRGGYMDCQKEEGPAPLLWRFSDFLKWSELCPAEPEIGHALMRLVITGQEIPPACEVELLILAHHFYKSSACLDGVDVLVALAATRVEAYVSEGDFSCLARLITGVGNLHALNFILGILIRNAQLDLLLQKYSAAAYTDTGTVEAVRGFRMAVLTSLKHFNVKDLDAFAMVYNHFDMKHETASLLESRAKESAQLWFLHNDKDQNEDLLDSMRYYIEAAEVHSSIDAGQKTRNACAQASLVSLQIRMPDFQWLNLSETNARRALVEQSRFQEALIVAEAYGLNQPSEWALVLWNQMLNPELTQEFVAEFVAVLPLQPSMLADLARFYRSEVAARGDQSQFSVWLTGGGLPAEWAKYLWRSFRCLLKRMRDLKLRMQLATVATGFGDVVDACMKALDKVPDNACPLVLRRGHGGAYLPLM